MTKDELRGVQLKQLEIMDAIHALCVKHGIRYYLIGGSALGAVRHKGFIPWDVDIDIAMPREDYEQFFNVYSQELPYNLKCHTYITDDCFIKPHGLVCMENTKLLTQADIDNPPNATFGIYIDVMPLDKCPDSKILQLKHAKHFRMCEKIKKYKLSRIYRENGFVTKCIKRTIRFIFLPISVRRINTWEQKGMRKYENLEPCNVWCSIGSKYPYKKQLMWKSVYGTPQPATFEGRIYFIPEQVDDYLRKLYGEYLRLPDKKTQEQMYNYFITASW